MGGEGDFFGEVVIAEEEEALARLPVGGGGFSFIAIGGLGEACVGGRIRSEVEVEIAEEKREALVTVLIEAEEEDFAAEVAGVLELEEVFVGSDGAGRGEGGGEVRRGVIGGGEFGGVDVAVAGLVPRFAGVEVGLGVPVVGEIVFDAEAALEGGDRARDGGAKRRVVTSSDWLVGTRGVVKEGE